MSNVAVCVRFRPPNSKEERHGSDVVSPGSADFESFALKDENNGETIFSFDRVFYKDCSQVDVYDVVALPIVKDAMNAINGTILAYGQTGAGKTYTMEGPNMQTDSAEMKGILPRVAQSIFELIQAADATSEFIIKLAMVEIYKEKIRDLFDASKDNLRVKEDKVRGIFVAGVTEVWVQSQEEMVKLLEAGLTNRAFGTTQMNARSSRSHCVSLLTIQKIDTEDHSKFFRLNCPEDIHSQDPLPNVRTGKLHLVDLAGSEKLEKTGVDGALFEEAKMINKSLSALGNVINSLSTDKAIHIPYRDSKLTRILQESLGGNSRTALLCCCSPSSLNSAESQSTLRFGARAKQIKNKPKINAKPGQNDLERLLEKSRQEYMELQTQFLLLNAHLGLSAEGTTVMSEFHVLNNRQDAPNSVLYETANVSCKRVLGQQGASARDGIVSSMTGLLDAGGAITSSTNLELPSPDNKELGDDDKEKLHSRYMPNLSRSSSDGDLESRSSNDAVSRTIHILIRAVVDLGRKCRKLLQENEALKAEMIAMERVLAHSRYFPDPFSESAEQKRLRPVRWSIYRLSWLGLRGIDAQQEPDCSNLGRSNSEVSTNLKLPGWSSLCKILSRKGLRERLSFLSL